MNKNKIRFYIVLVAVLTAFCVVALVVPFKATKCQHNICDEFCGYVEASEEIPCECPPAEDGSIEHIEGCSYAPAVEGVPCGHTCSAENGCVISAKNETFWISAGFAVLSILVQFYAMPHAMRGDSRSKFYGFPILRLSVGYLVVQIVLSIVFMAVAAWIPMWIPLVLFVLLLCVSLIGFVGADSVREEVANQDVQIKAEVSMMRALQSKANAMAAQCEGNVAKAAVSRFAEDLRFSDPVSNDAIADAETELAACIDNLQQAVVDGDEGEILTMCRKANAALAERNRLCKLNK